MTIDRERLAKRVRQVRSGTANAVPATMQSLAITDAILSDITAQGFVIVPREPTEAMAQVGGDAMAFDCWHNDIDDGSWPSPDEYSTDLDAQRSWARTAYAGYTAMITAANPEQTEQ